MTLQAVAVALIVPLCALYAAWRLMGVAARRRASAWLAKAPLPAAWRRRLLRVDAAALACGCDGCARHDGARAKPSARVIVHRHRGSR